MVQVLASLRGSSFEEGQMTALTDALRGVVGVTAIQLGSAIRDASRPK